MENIKSEYQEKNNQPMRLFIAVDMPDDVVQEVARIQTIVKKKDLFRGRYTDLNNMHITLKFLGDVAQETIPTINDALEKIHFYSLQAQLGSLDVFTSRKIIKILFLSIICPQLARLAQQIDEALSLLFERETRPFMGHLTIARIKEVYNQKKFLDEINRLKVEPLSFSISSFVLKQSIFSDQGPTYKEIKRYQLI